MIEPIRIKDRSRTAGKVALGFVVCLLAGSLPASASPFSSIKKALDQLNLPGINSTSQDQKFQDFLAGGPSQWSTTRPMKVPDGAPIVTPGGDLRDNRVVEYLTWARDRNPETFDRRHPALGAKLAAAEAQNGTQALMTPASSGTTAAIQASSAPSTPATPQAQVLQPPRVALETLTPPIPSSSFDPAMTREVSSPSVVTPHVVDPAQQSLEGSPAAIPEPSTVTLTLLLFGSAACWGRRRARA